MSQERWWERYSWVLLVLPTVFLVGEGVAGLLGAVMPDQDFLEPMTGRTWSEIESGDPRVAEYVQMANVWMWMSSILLGVFLVVIALIPFRRREQWAWWLLWTLPLSGLITAIIRLVQHDINTVPFTVPMIVMFGLALLLPVRRFFPRDDAPSPDEPATA